MNPPTPNGASGRLILFGRTGETVTGGRERWGGWRGRGGSREQWGGDRGSWRGGGREGWGGGRRRSGKGSSEKDQKKKRQEYSKYFIGRLDGLDTNRNGRLDPSEQTGEIRKIITHLGMKPNQSASIAGLKSRMKGSDLTKIRFGGWGRDMQKQTSESEEGKVPSFGGSVIGEDSGDVIPGFGLDTKEPKAPVLGFGESEHPVLKDRRPMEARFSKEAIEEARRTMKAYDRNKNGVLEPAEIKLVPWRNPPYTESDLDKNGFLSQVELAYRSDQRNKKSSRYRRNRSKSSFLANSKSSSKKPRSSNSKSNKSKKSKSPKKRSKWEEKQESIRWVKSVFAKYDKDGNGEWSRAEYGKIRLKPEGKSFTECDKNGDKKITLKEILPLYLDDVDASSISGAEESDLPKVRWSPLYEEGDSKSTLPSSMRSKDKNKNNQIEMHEYTSEWTASKLREFKKKDISGDGILTPEELSPSSSSSSSYSRTSSRSSKYSSRSKSKRSSRYGRSGSSYRSKSSSNSASVSGGKIPAFKTIRLMKDDSDK